MLTFQNPKGYTREYNDITDGLIFENKEICGGTIHPNTNTLLTALPNHAHVEVKMNKPAYGFRIFAYEGTDYTELTDGYSHYAYRYAGSPSTQYFVQIANQADGTISPSDGPTAIRCYTYTDRSEEKQSCNKLSGKNIAVIGDSIVQGRYSTDGETVNAVVQKPWSHLIAETANTEPANFGIGGASVVNIDWKSLYLNCEKVAGYDVVFVCAGTNDYAFDMDEAAFADAFSHVIERLRENNTEIIVCTPVIRTNRTHANRKGLTLADYARMETQIARNYNLQAIDLLTLSNTEDFKATLPDGLHPTQAGHNILAELILKAI